MAPMNSSGLRYEGPIYRPPSEANSLLVQATIGCPHNQCTFCMVYKNGPKFRVRSVSKIKEDLEWAKKYYGDNIRTVFFPAGNTIVMKTNDLVEICRYAKELFPKVERITVYGSAQFIVRKSLDELKKISDAGLSRIHVGLESGDDAVLRKMKKGSTAAVQITAGQLIKKSGIELSEYAVLGLGGKKGSKNHIARTINVLNEINPDFIRIRTLLPKIHTPLLEDIKAGKFAMLSPHGVLRETYDLVAGLDVSSQIVSDHYTNYIQIHGRLPGDKEKVLNEVSQALKRDEHSFREIYIGRE